MPHPLRRILTLPLLVLAALVVLFEEFVWDRVTALAAWLARWGVVARVEGWVLRRGRYTTLALFAVPILCLLPFKLLALYLIATGHLLSGILVIVAAKVTGTAISARLFVIAKPQLMTFALFCTVYAKVLGFKDWAHRLLDRLGVAAAVKRLKAGARALLARLPRPAAARSFLLIRFQAARRRLRRN